MGKGYRGRWSRIIYPKKLSGKLKHQKLDKQMFTGNKKPWKRVCE